jgi:hypothetical protein
MNIQYGTEKCPWGYWETKEGLKKWIIFIEDNIKRDKKIQSPNFIKMEKIALKKLKKI